MTFIIIWAENKKLPLFKAAVGGVLPG